VSSPLAEREARLELSLVFQYLGFSLIGLFFAFLLKLVLPLAILQPSWQLQWANALRTTAIFPLLGAVMLLLAQQLRPTSTSLAAQLLWVRRLAVAAAIGFLLLIPLQIRAGLSLLGAGNNSELAALRQVKEVAEEIRRANTEAAMRLALSRLPGAPAQIQGTFTKPLDQVRSVVLEQLQPQIQAADNRLAELRSLRLQAGWLGWITDGLAALALAACFAAIGQLQPGGSIVLLSVLFLPSLLLDRLRGSRRSGAGSAAPIDQAWLDSLHDGDDTPPSRGGGRR
jgi:ABC-type multidrug transport system fused ATPase/permease subunit